MVNVKLIENSSNNSLLHNIITQEITLENFAIVKGPKDIWRLIDKTKNFGYIYSEDNKKFILAYIKKLLENNFDSILISGLGLGIIPYICQNTTSIIDVVEINKDVINITKLVGHIHDSVNIIYDDIHNFIPQRKYDVILFDHWLTHVENTEIEILTQKFQNYINDNGFLYFPLNEHFKK